MIVHAQNLQDLHQKGKVAVFKLGNLDEGGGAKFPEGGDPLDIR